MEKVDKKCEGEYCGKNLPKENIFGGNSSEAISPGRVFG